MPVIEFIGYSRDEALEKIERYRPLLSGYPWTNDVIFIVGAGSIALGFDGVEQPYVRVRTRFGERARQLCEVLGPHEGVEVLLVEYHASPSQRTAKR
jgi:hypothetical protein